MFSQGSCIDVIQELLKSLYYHMERALAFSFSFPLAQQLVINHLGVFFFLFSRILVFFFLFSRILESWCNREP